ncbi:hypothetical protein H310_12324 [Aphanomyces invadans]|uniref:Uncharacterized protein n=1 Tax=Aphanomyces invadans TaxID=157072 RepID=A0A024TI76_9STRA|nr:hypothetical protein H310_12324 [Aphanomyces invadans]ETV93758.1 hypothetical protein H310_12324 [Aphanomyces invadans]RHY25260.1 hypothetical protein DYB32_008426 [Aphanomyces invadans]|eukprot:XP_008877567.1 hypothetical protein H310_12324 [Aphanomyces invadans]
MQPTQSSASLHPVDSLDLPKQLLAMTLTAVQVDDTATAPDDDVDDEWGWFEDLAIQDEDLLERFQCFHHHDLSHQSFE